MAYWFNVSTGQVETDEDKSQGTTSWVPTTQPGRGGATRCETARERTEQWDAEDRAWEEGRSED